LGLPNSQNLQFSYPILQFSPREVVSGVPPIPVAPVPQASFTSAEALHEVLYQFVDFSHHTARFIIFAQLALPSIIIIIILSFPILLIFGTYKITQNISLAFIVTGVLSHISIKHFINLNTAA